MSATTENILSEIREVENELSRAACKPDEHARLSAKLKELRQRFSACNEALNEGKQILKG